MSKIEAEQLSNIAGDRVGLVGGIVRGFAKAWANLNGTGTIALRDSENISSVTDNGTGDYTFNLTNAMANVNYACAHLVAETSSTSRMMNIKGVGQLVGSLTVVTKNTANAAVDLDIACFDLKGDLA